MHFAAQFADFCLRLMFLIPVQLNLSLQQCQLLLPLPHGLSQQVMEGYAFLLLQKILLLHGQQLVLQLPHSLLAMTLLVFSVTK